jgi:hypothetical protein
MDELALQRNKPYVTNTGLCIKQPTLDDIVDIGYSTYQSYLYAIISTPKDVADILWCKMKVWYEDIKSDWVFFLQSSLTDSRNINVIVDDYTTIALGINEEQKNAFNFFLGKNYDYIIVNKKDAGEELSDVYIMGVEYTDDTKETCIINNNSFKISEDVYNDIVMFLKSANWASFEYDFTKGGTKRAKKYILEHDYKARMKQKKSNVTLSSIVSSLIAKGQSYSGIWGLPVYMVYDLYYRYIKIDDWNNTMRALHSGCIDTKKNPINWEKINWSSVITK